MKKKTTMHNFLLNKRFINIEVFKVFLKMIAVDLSLLKTEEKWKSNDIFQ